MALSCEPRDVKFQKDDLVFFCRSIFLNSKPDGSGTAFIGLETSLAEYFAAELSKFRLSGLCGRSGVERDRQVPLEVAAAGFNLLERTLVASAEGGASSSRIGETFFVERPSMAGIPRASASRLDGKETEGDSWSPADRADKPLGSCCCCCCCCIIIECESTLMLAGPEPDRRRSCCTRGESGSCAMVGIGGAMGSDEDEKPRSRSVDGERTAAAPPLADAEVAAFAERLRDGPPRVVRAWIHASRSSSLSAQRMWSASSLPVWDRIRSACAYASSPDSAARDDCRPIWAVWSGISPTLVPPGWSPQNEVSYRAQPAQLRGSSRIRTVS